jgi:hypothetical protein
MPSSSADLPIAAQGRVQPNNMRTRKGSVRVNAFSKGIKQRMRGMYGRFQWKLMGIRVTETSKVSTESIKAQDSK